MKTSTTTNLCKISAASCYQPACLYDSSKSLEIWAFFQWKNDTTVRKIVFGQLPGDKQVGSVSWEKDTLIIKLVKGAKAFRRFNIKRNLVKDHHYPCIVDFNDPNLKSLDGPEKPGNVIIREVP